MQPGIREAALLRFIQGYQLAHDGISPSLRECASGIGAAGPSSAHKLIVSLEAIGAIRRLPRHHRAIAVLMPIAIPTMAGEPLFAVAPARKAGRAGFSASAACHERENRRG